MQHKAGFFPPARVLSTSPGAKLASFGALHLIHLGAQIIVKEDRE